MTHLVTLMTFYTSVLVACYTGLHQLHAFRQVYCVIPPQHVQLEKNCMWGYCSKFGLLSVMLFSHGAITAVLHKLSPRLVCDPYPVLLALFWSALDVTHNITTVRGRLGIYASSPRKHSNWLIWQTTCSLLLISLIPTPRLWDYHSSKTCVQSVVFNIRSTQLTQPSTVNGATMNCRNVNCDC